MTRLPRSRRARGSQARVDTRGTSRACGNGMRMITRLLLASVLAAGAAGLAGCGDVADCPALVTAGDSCASEGLSCFVGNSTCTCHGGQWGCGPEDLSMPLDLSPRDLGPATD